MFLILNLEQLRVLVIKGIRLSISYLRRLMLFFLLLSGILN